MRHAILAVLLLSAGACCPKGQVNQPGMFGGVNCVPESGNSYGSRVSVCCSLHCSGGAYLDCDTCTCKTPKQGDYGTEPAKIIEGSR